MKSFFDPCYREKDCVPVAYSWYDRADMMKTTLEAVNHSHSLCEIMYVCEGGMSIETEAGRVELGRRQLVWLDAGIRHWNMSFSNELCSMMNIEFQYEVSDDRAPSLRAIAQQDEATRHMLERGARVAVLNDTDNTLFRLMKAAIPETMKVKAAGGMHSWQEALAMVDAGASRLGTSSTLKILEGAEE